jgi:alkylation response protein AidB-like acyl-CoA dehydrogenase
MDFSLSDEQSMLAESVARFIDNDYGFESRQQIAEGSVGYSRDMWQTYAELGWTAVPFDEEDGGLGGGPIELILMMEQFGRGLVVEPYLATIVLAGGALRRAASANQKKQWLSGIIEGQTQAALAFAEPQSRFTISDIATKADANGNGFILNGRKNLVLNGSNADLLIIPARTGGAQTDENGITLFVVAADSAGIDRRDYATVDAHHAADLSLKDVRVDSGSILGDVGQGYSTLQDVVDEATLAVCAEAVGILRTLHDKTVEYAKNRVQFGVPIGTFQALQHRMVDMLMACEQTHSLLLWAAMLTADGDADARKAISALKYQIGTAGRTVAQEAVQIHGGMGVTWELDISHYFKRFTAIELLFGNADFHLNRYLASSE